jgi:RHS repeat-associated protein
LTSVTGSGTATFVYDGDGNRVKATLNGATTAYVGNYYEQTGSAIKKYYYAGGTRIALNDNSTLYWLLGDHLGSTAIAANGTTGAWYAEQRYKPWGEQRYPSGASTLPTRHRFTGQVEDSEIGLYFYGARMYSVLGRFVSADTIVPSASDPQQLNRYAYALNSPLNYTDPSGHAADAGGAGGSNDVNCLPRPDCYDLTAYLALAMSKHARDPRLQWIAEGINPPQPPVTSLGADSYGLQWLGYSLGRKAGAYGQFNGLESAFKEWDIKRSILMRFKSGGIILCGETCDWYDYSTLGNIHFGYVAGRAGIDHEVAAIAGGILEQSDMLQKEAKIDLSYCNWTLKCDNPQDQAAVDFGYYLAKKYPSGVTHEILQKELTVNITSQFQRPINPYFRPPFFAHPQQNPYRPDSFNWPPQ